ncbi:MFS transporter, partial [Lysobacter sp. 2RAB21]
FQLTVIAGMLCAPFLYRDARARIPLPALATGAVIVAGVLLLQLGHGGGRLDRAGWIALVCVAIGAVFSLAVLLQPMSAATGWSRAGLSSAMTLAFLSMGFAGFGWGILSDRFGPRVVVLAGSLLLGLACILASRA